MLAMPRGLVRTLKKGICNVNLTLKTKTDATVPQLLSVLLLKAFQVALHFSSLVLLSSTQTFLLARVQHFQALS